MLSVKTPLIELKGVGEALNQRLIAVGLKTVNDLIGYFPRKYSDYSKPTKSIDKVDFLESEIDIPPFLRNRDDL